MALSVSITKPTVGGDDGAWGGILNTALDDIVDGINTDVQAELDLKAALAGDTFTGAVTISSGGLTISGGGLTVTSGTTEIRNRFKQESTRSSGGTSNTINPDLSTGNVWIQTMSTNSSANFGDPTSKPATTGLHVSYLYITAHSDGNAIASSGGAVTIGFPAALSASSVNLIRLIVASGHVAYEYIGEVA